MAGSVSANMPIYRVGTLSYTKRALFILFMWLLWGDLCFTLMEIIEPSVLPFILKSQHASDKVISIYITTIAGFFNLTICPLASFWSDRYRSPKGRRLPFLVYSTPFVGLFLVLTGFSREIGGFLYRTFFSHGGFTPTGITIGCIAFMVVGYQVFHMVVASVYYYLFNDVVPEEYLGRFMALFRTVGTLAGALFNFVVFQYARSDAKEIFIVFGLLYAIGFFAMCLKVKEGEYPPPPAMEKSSNTLFAGFKTFFKESFCHKLYMYFYLSYGFWYVQNAILPFVVFRNLDIGLSMKEIGMLTGATGIITAILLVPAGYLVDKRHPIRVGLGAMIWTLVFLPLNAIFFWRMSHSVALALSIVVTAVTIPVTAIFTASELPLFMRLLPHSRYGQFCSANAIVRSFMLMIAGLACGWYLDRTKLFMHNTANIDGNYYYRAFFIWQMVFCALALIFRVKLYKLWLKQGADENYMPPMFENDEDEVRIRHQRSCSSAAVSES